MTSVVMLHGWGMNARVFEELAAGLAPNYEIRTPDLPGYGSAPTCEPYTLANLVSCVASEAPQRCCVVGWSLGAQIALEWARTLPRQAERLVIMGATPCFVQRRDWTCAMEATTFEGFYDALAIDAAAALDRFVSLQAQGDSDPRRVMRRLRAVVSAVETPPLNVLQHGLEILGASDLRACLGGIEQPVLVIQGERDRLVPLSAGDYLARTLSKGRIASIGGAAHAPFIAAPQSVARMIREFLDGH